VLLGASRYEHKTWCDCSSESLAISPDSLNWPKAAAPLPTISAARLFMLRTLYLFMLLALHCTCLCCLHCFCAYTCSCLYCLAVCAYTALLSSCLQLFACVCFQSTPTPQLYSPTCNRLFLVRVRRGEGWARGEEPILY